ncbi:hypothetical protein AGMMS49983_20130 [Clostridia bacterium]|nr:hypothetical protein AGMMS49983_20130 [Clostridia bacterium]
MLIQIVYQSGARIVLQCPRATRFKRTGSPGVGRDILFIMFGYIAPLKSELKVREFEVYSAYYCAVCRAVGRRYGELPRLMLSYDAAFVALLGAALGVDGQEPAFRTFRCFNNPQRKRNEAVPSPSIDYAADVLVLLGHLGLKDRKEDGDAEGFLKKCAVGCGEAFIRGAGRRAAARIPDQALEVCSCLAAQAELEAAKAPEIDRAADPTGRFMASLLDYPSVPGLVHTSDAGMFACLETPEATKTSEIFNTEAASIQKTSEALRKLGYHLGRFIYIIDAVCDLEQDRKMRAYNPLLLQEIPTESLEASLFLDLAQMGESVAKLPLIYHKNIIENVVYLGLNAVKDEALGRNPGASRGKRRYLRP